MLGNSGSDCLRLFHTPKLPGKATAITCQSRCFICSFGTCLFFWDAFAERSSAHMHSCLYFFKSWRGGVPCIAFSIEGIDLNTGQVHCKRQTKVLASGDDKPSNLKTPYCGSLVSILLHGMFTVHHILYYGLLEFCIMAFRRYPAQCSSPLCIPMAAVSHADTSVGIPLGRRNCTF